MKNTENSKNEKWLEFLENTHSVLRKARLVEGELSGKEKQQLGFERVVGQPEKQDAAALSGYVVKLEKALIKAGFVSRVFEKESLSHQYQSRVSSGRIGASISLTRKGVYLYASLL